MKLFLATRFEFVYAVTALYFKYKCTNGILLPKLFWPTMRKKCCSDREKLLKFKAEGRELAKIPKVFLDH